MGDILLNLVIIGVAGAFLCVIAAFAVIFMTSNTEVKRIKKVVNANKNDNPDDAAKWRQDRQRFIDEMHDAWEDMWRLVDKDTPPPKQRDKANRNGIYSALDLESKAKDIIPRNNKYGGAVYTKDDIMFSISNETDPKRLEQLKHIYNEMGPTVTLQEAKTMLRMRGEEWYTRPSLGTTRLYG
jgi:hypothetical protein